MKPTVWTYDELLQLLDILHETDFKPSQTEQKKFCERTGRSASAVATKVERLAKAKEAHKLSQRMCLTTLEGRAFFSHPYWVLRQCPVGITKAVLDYFGFNNGQRETLLRSLLFGMTLRVEPASLEPITIAEVVPILRGARLRVLQADDGPASRDGIYYRIAWLYYRAVDEGKLPADLLLKYEAVPPVFPVAPASDVTKIERHTYLPPKREFFEAAVYEDCKPGVQLFTHDGKHKATVIDTYETDNGPGLTLMFLPDRSRVSYNWPNDVLEILGKYLLKAEPIPCGPLDPRIVQFIRRNAPVELVDTFNQSLREAENAGNQN